MSALRLLLPQKPERISSSSSSSSSSLIDLARMRWERESAGGGGEISCGPGKRWGHTCNAIKEGRFLYVFGGYGHHNCQTNQVHVFDTATQRWSQPSVKGTAPAPRDSHTCTTVGDNLYVFGGTDGINPLNDLYILDTSSHKWMCPSLRGEGPEAREGHSAALVGKRLFVFGGCGKSLSNYEVYYNDLFILNTETFSWKRALTKGTPPSPRDSHTCSSWKNNLVVIGGEDGHDYYLADVHILDTDTLVWRELNTSGFLLTARAGHSTVAFDKKLFVFGGFTDAQNLYSDLFMLDIETAVWIKVVTAGGPSARFSVAGDCIDPQKKGVLVFLGGCNKSLEGLDDMYYLHTGLTRESERRLEKLSLKKQLKLKCQEQNLIPVHDNYLHRFGIGASSYQSMNMPVYGQPCGESFSLMHFQHPQGKRMFQARVTERISDGYTIETTIDGKPLRGILFSDRKNHDHKAVPDSSRKRAVGMNGDHNNQTKVSKVLKTDGQNDNLKTDQTTDSQDIAVPVSNDQTREISEVHEPQKVIADVRLPLTSVDQENEQSKDAVESDREVPGPNVINSEENSDSQVPKENLPAPEINSDSMMLPDQGH